MVNLLTKILGDPNVRAVKRARVMVAQVHEHDKRLEAMSAAELKAQTESLRERLAKGESLDEVLPEAFATVREAAWRVIKQRHYDVQLIGGLV
ncbi:MAG TPA: preprotein translocase subunit SecA, partial [Candidatus Saccharimonas sp.]|nr:preprotein translocase subunit SecA [Candidatus Saccharimonas sp.]